MKHVMCPVESPKRGNNWRPRSHDLFTLMPTMPKTMRQRQLLSKGIKREDNRPNSNSRGYGHKWRKYRRLYLTENPLCVLCQQKGITTAATVVDHIIPHKGNITLFWDIHNHQSLCVRCHNSKSAKE